MAQKPKVNFGFEIDRLTAVVEGRDIGHVFRAHLEPPFVVFEEGMPIGSEDISVAEALLSVVKGEGFVYCGELAPEEARSMRAEIAEASILHALGGEA